MHCTALFTMSCFMRVHHNFHCSLSVGLRTAHSPAGCQTNLLFCIFCRVVTSYRSAITNTRTNRRSHMQASCIESKHMYHDVEPPHAKNKNILKGQMLVHIRVPSYNPHIPSNRPYEGPLKHTDATDIILDSLQGATY